MMFGLTDSSRGSGQRWLWSLALGLGLLVCGPGDTAAKQQADCVKLFRAKKLVKSADCFVAIARKLPAKGLTEQQKTSKGRALRNAAIALQRAAAATKRVGVASFLRTRAVRLLSQYLLEKLYEAPYRKREAALKMHQIRQQIGTGTLTILTGRSNATISLRGYRFKQRSTGRWSQAVRPGSYVIRVQYPSSTKAEQRKIFLPPYKSKIVSFSPPAVRRPPVRRIVARRPARRPPLRRVVPSAPARPYARAGLVLALVGAAVALGGGGVLIGAGVVDGQKTSLNQELKGRLPQDGEVDSLVQMHAQTTAMFPAGWVLLGGGLGLAAVGVVLALIKRGAPPKPTAAASRTSRRSGRPARARIHSRREVTSP